MIVLTKAEIERYLKDYDDDEEISLDNLVREYEEARRERIEEIEERQHQSGFYTPQGKMEMRDDLWNTCFWGVQSLENNTEDLRTVVIAVLKDLMSVLDEGKER